jgi:hypothetical protein
MTIKIFSYSFALLALFAFAGTAAAQSSTVPRLTMNTTVVTAMRLEISSAVGGVVGTGTASDFVVNLGSVNALGIGSPATGVTVTATPGLGAAGFAIYTTPIVLTPIFSGFTAANMALTVGGGTNDAIAVEGDSHLLATVAAARVVASSASDVANERHVGFKINKTEAAGPRNAAFLYTITVLTP